MTGRLIPYGPAAWLVEHDDPAAFAGAVRAGRPAGVVDVVPAARTVLVTFTPGTDAARLAAWLAAVPVAGAGIDADRTVVELAVVYDGEDLPTVAELTGLRVADVIARHRDSTYRCAFCGFAPGFGYLTGLDPVLHVPRRATPRARIPAGAVAIAGEYTAAYPSASPGGWHLLGRTNAPLWRTDRDPPALVTPGATVRFVDIGA